MIGLNSQTSASAVYYVAAMTAGVMGLVGFVFYYLTAPYTLLEIIPMRTAFGALIVALGFIGVAVGGRITQIVIGAACVFLALAQLADRVATDADILLEQGTLLRIAINIHFLLIGLAFLFPPRMAVGRVVWFIAAYFSLALSLELFAYGWFPDTHNLNLPLPMSFIAVNFLIALSAVMFFARLKWRHETFKIDTSVLVPASLVSMVGIVIWFSLSAQTIRDIDDRAEILLEQTINNVDARLDEHLSGLRRLAVHWSHLSDQEITLLPDSMAFLEDHPIVVHLALYDANGRLLYEALSPHAHNQAWTVDASRRDPPSEWLDTAFGSEAALVSRESTLNGAPLMYLTTPLVPEPYRGVGTHEPRETLQAVMSLDVLNIVNLPANRFLDFFTVYAEVSTDLVIATVGEQFQYFEKSEFETQNPYVYARMATLLGVYDRSFYVAMQSTEVIWRSARVNQFVFILSSLFALLLVIVADSNKQLTEERDKLHQLATYDGVTGLVRRDVLEQRLQRMLDEKRRAVYVMFIDLDGFKPINDTIGIALGNDLLSDVGERIRRVGGPNSLVSRFSGDEYILVTESKSSEDLNQLANRLLLEIRQPFVLDGVGIHLTASIGIASVDFSEKSAELMIQNADMAMTGAKRSGGNTYLFFAPIMAASYNRKVELRARIQEAILNDEFEVYYQPIVATKDAQIIGLEALIRWPQADGSMISPGELIPVAEHTGQILEISDIVFRKAFRDLHQLDATGWFVSLNFSGRLFHRGDIVNRVQYLMENSRVSGKRVHIEVTESIFADDQHRIPEKLRALQKLGLSISIDDFGTGYSSLSMLYKLPLDVIKIDRTFIHELEPESQAYQVAESVIELAQKLNKRVIVEGIETEDQVKFCKEKRCDAIQGFYYYRPMPFSEIQKLAEKAHA